MTSFVITDVYTSTPGPLGTEEKHTPMIGEYYRLAVEFDVTGTPSAHYPIFFSMADRVVTQWVADLTPGHKLFAANFFLPLDGPIPWEVDVDPYDYADGVDPNKSPIPLTFPDVLGSGQTTRLGGRRSSAGNATRKGSFEPAPPRTPIDYYSPETAYAFQSLDMTFPPGRTVERLRAIMGSPSSASWQQLTSGSCSVQHSAASTTLSTVPADPAKYPVYFWDQSQFPGGKVTMAGNWVLQLSKVRVDGSRLRDITWDNLDQTRKSQPYAFYSAPEAVIESTDPKITAFVTSLLGTNYRQAMTPYDAARKLFQAVLAHTTYYFPAPGQPDLRPTTAVGMLDKAFGDCGGFSILLVALFRNIGFAARTACGFWMGLNQGHCWCELYFPRLGWVLCDGSVGNKLSESGEFAYYFGNLPDLNIRFAIMRGNSFAVGGIGTSWLQGPYDQVDGTVTAQSTSASTIAYEHLKISLTVPQTQTSPSEQITDALQLAAHRCPCAQHGGFRPIPRQTTPS